MHSFGLLYVEYEYSDIFSRTVVLAVMDPLVVFYQNPLSQPGSVSLYCSVAGGGKSSLEYEAKFELSSRPSHVG